MKRLFSIFVCLAVVISVFSVFPGTAYAATSGTCGEDLTWSFSDGTLTISGTGNMDDYTWTYTAGVFITTAPWRDIYLSIETVDIAPGVTSIGDEAFIGCAMISSVTIPYGVTSIGEEAFNGCESLTSITFPDSLNTIGKVSFKLTSLTSVEIPDSVTSIGVSAFFGCASLTSVKIGKGVASIGVEAFSGCRSLESFTVDRENTVYHAKGDCIIETETKTLIAGCKNSVIPSDGSVTSIGTSAFSYCKSLTSIGIPDSVTSIADSAFDNCARLKTVTMGEGVMSIGASAFNKCSLLNSIEMPDSVASIGNAAFEQCDVLRYNVYDNAKYLGNGTNPYVALIKAVSKDASSFAVAPDTKVICPAAFEGCASLKDIEIPDSVRSIGDGAFSGCTSLTSAEIGEGVTSIGSSAFEGCAALMSITVPESVTSLGSDAFSGCDSLIFNLYGNAKYLGNSFEPYLILVKAKSPGIESCAINRRTRFIHSSAFEGCASLSSVTIGKSVTEIGGSAFSGCTSLTYVVIPEGVKTIGGKAFSGCASFGEIWMPGSVSAIGEMAFFNCNSLNAVNISDLAAWCAISFDDYYANPLPFAKRLFIDGEQVTDLVIPDGVTSIGDYAFDGFTSLSSVVFPDSLIKIGEIAFKGCGKLTEIVIPDSVKSVGKEAFRYCTKLRSVTVGKSVALIDKNAFRACSALESVTLARGIISIGNFAFYACDALTTVKYHGSASDWALISKGRDNGALTAAAITFDYHIFGDAVITEPTCTIPGYILYKCVWCSIKRSEPIPATGHDFEVEFTVDVEPTDTEPGQKSRHCRRCGEVTDVKIIPPLSRLGTLIFCDGVYFGIYQPEEVIELPVPETVIEGGATKRFFGWSGADVTRSAFGAGSGTANRRTYTMTVPEEDTYLIAEYVYVGDISVDGLITLSDITVMKRMLAGTGVNSEKSLEAADLNFDGLNTLTDIGLLKTMIAG